MLKFAVVPHAGTWIEISNTIIPVLSALVVPHAGTWIEICGVETCRDCCLVVPHAGTWIEMRALHLVRIRSVSFPTRERGLKSSSGISSRCPFGRSPRGNVD